MSWSGWEKRGGDEWYGWVDYKEPKNWACEDLTGAWTEGYQKGYQKGFSEGRLSAQKEQTEATGEDWEAPGSKKGKKNKRPKFDWEQFEKDHPKAGETFPRFQYHLPKQGWVDFTEDAQDELRKKYDERSKDPPHGYTLKR